MNSGIVLSSIGPTKKSIDDLAIFGGQPAFSEPVHVGRPNIGDRTEIRRRIEDILDRRWLSNAGPNVRELESRLAALLGVKHVVCTCNGTVALEIAIRAAGLTGEVILPSFTFVATAHALQWQQVTPVFCDVDPVTHNIDPARVEDLITPLTSAIIGVHVWGRPCNVSALEYVVRRHGLELMFDAAHAFCCTHQGQPVGGFGRAEIFSFHATKFFNTLEGGAVATNDDEFAQRIRLMKNFGFTDYDRVVHVGTNGKMNEICAAVGLVGLDSVEDFIEINRRNDRLYRENLQLPGLRVIDYPVGNKQNFQYMIVEIDEEDFGLSRDELLFLLHTENILARRYFYPGCHRMAPYRTHFPHAGILLPQTEALCRRVMALPTGTGIDEEGIRVICDLIALFVKERKEIERRGRLEGSCRHQDPGASIVQAVG